MNTRETKFLAKLCALLDEYDAEISAHEGSGGYYTYIDSMAIYSDAKWDKHGNQIRDMIDVSIDGSFIDTGSIKQYMEQ